MPKTKKARSLSEIIEEMQEVQQTLKQELAAINAALAVLKEETFSREVIMWEMYQQGHSLKHIADEFGISRQRIGQILEAKQHTLRTKQEAQAVRNASLDQKYLDEYADEIKDLFVDQELPVTQIAKKLDLSPDRIRKILETLLSKEVYHELALERQRITLIDRQFSSEELLNQLQRCAEELGRTPGVAAFDEWTGLNRAQLIIMRFGTWREACVAAGLKPHKKDPHPKWGARKYSDEDCKLAVQRVQKIVGRKPTINDYDSNRLPTEPTVATLRQRNDNSWLKALDCYCD